MTPDPDLALVTGLALSLLSLLSFAAAWTDGRRPWVGAAILALGLGLVMTAFTISPEGYGPRDVIPTIFTVLGRYLL